MRNHALNYKPNDEYYTPAWIFETLGIVFDLDVASPTDPVEWLPAKHRYDIETDGLLSPWFGNVWMNPPFSKQKPWIEKFIDHSQGIALLPWAKSKSLNLIWDKADGIVMLPSNLKFQHRIEGTKGIFVSCGLFAFGQKNLKALERLENKVRT